MTHCTEQFSQLACRCPSLDKGSTQPHAMNTMTCDQEHFRWDLKAQFLDQMFGNYKCYIGVHNMVCLCDNLKSHLNCAVITYCVQILYMVMCLPAPIRGTRQNKHTPFSRSNLVIHN